MRPAMAAMSRRAVFHMRRVARGCAGHAMMTGHRTTQPDGKLRQLRLMVRARITKRRLDGYKPEPDRDQCREEAHHHAALHP
jgi:hypothetical protein